ncbi:unnamed protein product [Durusdinium trenchii]|uniref:alpha-galactosidase n=2 Tax=Durusdinium trenchii TaxID=1381693 RepID=A0ABP0N5D1_9DINO
MAHLVDKQVAGRVVLQPAPTLESRPRVSYSFHDLVKLEKSEKVELARQQSDGDKRRHPQRSRSGSRPSLKASEAWPRDYSPGRPSPSLSGSRASSAFHHWSFPEFLEARAEDQSREREVQESFLISFDKTHSTFHLKAGTSHYAFCVDQYGALEHLHYGNWVGMHDFTFLSETDPALTFEPAPAGTQYSMGELLRMVEDEDDIDPQQLWSLATNMKSERGGDWHMARVENLTWRLRNMWSKNGQEAKNIGAAQRLLQFLEKSSVPLKKAPEEMRAPEGLQSVGGRQGLKGSQLLEVSEFGTGDFRTPSMDVCFRKDGSRLLPLVYKHHRVIDGILPSTSGLPFLGRHNSQGAQSLVVDMVDTYTEVQVQLVYTVFPSISAVSRRMVVKNSSKVGLGGVDLMKCMSATFDFSTDDWHLLSLHGGWANERHINTRRIQEGMIHLGSNRGVSSHQMNPFCVLSSGPPAEDHGQCFGFCLLYSGNWLMEVEQSQTGCVRVNVGLSNTHFSWALGNQESFETPECVCVFSDAGLGKMTRTFQHLIGERLIAPRWHDLVCPVLINTWEALYFEVYHDKILEFAKPAIEAGVELLVLDDGWFGKRDDDTTSLGDWVEDPRKLPRGLKGLAQDVNAMGLKLGIWVEPEMVNQDSQLYRSHPEWVLHHPGRLRSEGRNQLVLDLTRREVQDYIIDCVSQILSSANIEYIKWDMNRALTDAFSAALPPQQQGEVYHRYVLGLYRIFEVLTSSFPHVLFESCASGGGRFDAALLAWCPQAWCSDNSDAFSRTRIQMGTSMWAPVRCMGAHIAACPSHQTHRTHMLKTRFIVALWGTFGLELDLNKLSREELKEMKELVALRGKLCQVVLHGEYFRLPGFGYPGASHSNSAGIGDSHVYAWMFVTPEKDRAVVGKFPSRLKLQGLRPDYLYSLIEHVPTTVEEGVFNGIFQPGGPQFKHRRRLMLTGAVLMEVGIPVHFNFDGDAMLLELEVGGPSQEPKESNGVHVLAS